MATKKIVQDIVPSGKRSIRNISIDHREKFAERVEKEEIEKEIEEKPIIKRHKTKRSTPSLKYILSFALILISLTIICIALSLLYSKATITITPKIVDFEISGDFTAKKSNPLSTNSGDLTYESISVSDTLTQTIEATKGPSIQTKAKGTAIIYNNYSSSPQTLVAGTRLASSNGLIYRISNTISVPGKKTNPGSIAVNIVADQVGEKYNLNILDLKGDLKLLGYKGTDKYDGFYGKLKTDLIGGFSGNKMIIDEETKKASVASMRDILKNKILEKLNQNTPNDHILYPGAYSIDYNIPEPIMKGTTTAEMTVSATGYGAIFNTNILIKNIAGKEIKKFPSDTYNIEGEKTLEFKISNTKDFSAKKGTSMIFTLRGPISITGTFDEIKLKNELKGLKIKESSGVFAKYSAITSANSIITPFWLTSFPDSINKINIEYKH